MNIKGEIIKKYRKINKMTQFKVAELVGISSNHLSEVERGSKGISKKTVYKLNNIFSFTEEELRILLKINKEKEVKIREKELEKKEKELIETYDFIRQHHNIFSMASKINRNLIELNKCMENYLSEIEILLNKEDDKLLSQVERPIKVTLKRMKEKEKRLEKLLKIDELNIMDGEE